MSAFVALDATSAEALFAAPPAPARSLLVGRYIPPSEARSLDLDPIHVAGAFNLRLLRCRAPWMTLAVGVLQDENVFVANVLRPEARHRASALMRSHVGYADWVDNLCSWNVLRWVVDGDRAARNFATIFGVTKADGGARAIINCARGLNKDGLEPPPVRLTSVVDLARAVRRIAGDLEMVDGDLRHWYWQIPAGPHVGARCRIVCDGRATEPTVVPMGWSWGVWIGQCLAWAMLCNGSDEELLELGIDPAIVATTEHPPSLLLLRRRGTSLYDDPEDPGEIVGVIVLYIDGVLVVASKTSGLAVRWATWLQGRTANCGAVWKAPPTVKSQTNFLGFDLFCGRGFLFRLTRETLIRWDQRAEYLKVAKMASFAEWAWLPGVVAALAHAQDVPFALFPAVLRLGRWLTAGAATYDWSAITEIPQDVLGPALREGTTFVRSRGSALLTSEAWEYFRPELAVRAAADATPERIAWAVGPYEAKIPARWKARPTIEADLGSPIWVGEFRAALCALATAMAFDRPFVVLYSDNTITLACIRRRSPPQGAAAIVGQVALALFEAADSLGLRILAKWVPSLENPVDGMSRGKSAPDKKKWESLCVREEVEDLEVEPSIRDATVEEINNMFS